MRFLEAFKNNFFSQTHLIVSDDRTEDSFLVEAGHEIVHRANDDLFSKFKCAEITDKGPGYAGNHLPAYVTRLGVPTQI